MPARWTTARKNAQWEGRKRFIGEPCPKGHIERFISSGECCACHDARARGFRESNGKGVVHHRIKSKPRVTSPHPAIKSGSEFIREIPLSRLMAGK